MYTFYSANKLVDWRWRGQSFTPPATNYFGLIMASRGLSSTIRSALVSTGDTVIPNTANGRIYKCTTGGTTGSGEPTYPTTNGGTVTDGTAVWTEQTLEMRAGTFKEATYGSYARQGVAASLAAMAGTQGATTTAASSGSSAVETSNNAAIVFPVPTSGTGVIFGIFSADAVSAGNILEFGANATPLAISIGGSAPTFAISQLVLTPFNLG